MASKIADFERGWYYRRAGHSAAMNIMGKGARGVIITLAGKLTGSRHRTQKFIQGHIKYCGETAIEHMDRGYAVAVKKLGTIGVTVAIMRPGTKLPHEVTIFSDADSPSTRSRDGGDYARSNNRGGGVVTTVRNRDIAVMTDEAMDNRLKELKMSLMLEPSKCSGIALQPW